MAQLFNMILFKIEKTSVWMSWLSQEWAISLRAELVYSGHETDHCDQPLPMMLRQGMTFTTVTCIFEKEFCHQTWRSRCERLIFLIVMVQAMQRAITRHCLCYDMAQDEFESRMKRCQMLAELPGFDLDQKQFRVEVGWIMKILNSSHPTVLKRSAVLFRLRHPHCGWNVSLKSSEGALDIEKLGYLESYDMGESIISQGLVFGMHSFFQNCSVSVTKRPLLKMVVL